MNIIPLTPGLAYYRFSAVQSNVKLLFYFHWLTRYQYFSVDIFDAENNPVVCGRALHPGMNLLDGINRDCGSLILEGEPPTINNLGIKNQLTWTL
jgi:hypothetical protein